MKLWEKQAIFADNVSRLLNYMITSGKKPTLGDAFRSPEQAALNVKNGTGIADSLHCKRLAIDINVLDKDGTYHADAAPYKPFADFWVTLHPLNRAGYYFKKVDANHFEMQDL